MISQVGDNRYQAGNLTKYVLKEGEKIQEMQ
jgi:hypothetical protein